MSHEHYHHEHDHHGHHHHHHAHAIERLSTIYIVAVALNLLFVVVEAVAGFVGHSLGLLSDAGHNLSDVFSLLLAMVALKLASSRATRRFTYGYRKASVLISLLNAIILLIAVGAIMVESVRKFMHPADVNGTLIVWTAAVGIVINGLTACPIIGLVIAVVILFSTWSLLAESLRMSTDAVPEGFDVEVIKQKIEGQEGVLNVHHMHV